MSNIRQKPATASKPAQLGKKCSVSGKVPPLADELLQLNDDFTEFSEINAFMCHAFATALSGHESLNKDIISGARRCSNWLQFRSVELKNDIRHVHARYAAEHIAEYQMRKRRRRNQRYDRNGRG
jgi:hypothetical protein